MRFPMVNVFFVLTDAEYRRVLEENRTLAQDLKQCQVTSGFPL